MIVAYVCDEKYLPFLRISMASIKRYNKDVKFVVLTKERFYVEGAKVITFTPDTGLFKFRGANDRMGDGVYYKFYLPLLPYDKVLYIDCDVVCQRPLNELWETECPFICATESHAYGLLQARELGLKRYALTGMMLLNLKEMRRANFTKRCLARLQKEQPRFHDETIINLEFFDRIKFIDKKFNYCRHRVYAQPILESDAYLLHYVGATQKEEMLALADFGSLQNLKFYMKSASVAIVGNSEKILGQNYGAEIDGHDIIIRFNKGWPDRNPAALGSRTNYLFLACTLTNRELEHFGNCKTIRRSSLCQNMCNYSLGSQDRRQLKQGSSQPSTGFIAINLALAADAKKISLFGFDFFKSPTYYNEPNYKTLHNGFMEAQKVLEYQKYGLLKIYD